MNFEQNYRHWWKSPDKQSHENVYQYLQHLENSQSYRTMDNLRNMRLYGDFSATGLDSYSYSQTDASSSTNHRVTLNIIQSMVDTAVSKITKNKPKPTFLTAGGAWGLQQKAKKLGKFCEGIFHDTGLYEEGVKAFTDACIFGTGAIKIFADAGKICAERVLIDEIKVDDAEAFYGKPRQIHQVKYIHKDVLKEQFPDCSASIEQSSDMAPNSGSSYSNAKDMIKVIESWRLPSSKDAKDGKHVITIHNCTLFEEDYKKQHFPFVFIRWTERPIGFFGKGISEQLQGIQLEINKILRTIQVSMHLTSIPKVFVEASSKVVTSHLNNKIGGIIKYAGTKPSYESVGSIPSELFSHLDRLYNRAYEIVGISSLSARSEKPAGLDSGKALRDFNDIESERFLCVGKRYENMFIESAEIIIDLAREIYEDIGELKVRVKGEKFIETIDWKEVDMEEDKYMMQIFPTSSLSSTPSGRLQDVQELMQAGLISTKDGKKLLDFPDLEAVMNLETANEENIDRQIDIMVNKGVYESPEPYQDLDLATKKVQQAYLYYRHQGLSEERLELLRNYIEDVQGMVEAMATANVAIQENAAIAEQAATAPLPELPAEEPIAVPEAPPSSDLLPL